MTTPQTPDPAGLPPYAYQRQPTPGNAYPVTTEPWPAPQRTSYLPTAAQLARDEQLKRHNRRTIYVPVIIAAVVAVALFILLLVLAFGLRETGQAREFIAGMSAIMVILMAIPTIVLMAILPVAYAAFLINRRNQRKLYPETGPNAYRSRIQIFLWQADSFLAQASREVERGSDALAEPFIRFGGYGAYARTMAEQLKRNFSRSDENIRYDNNNQNDEFYESDD